MKEILTDRLILREFAESDRGDLYEFLLQLKDDEFEGYPDNSQSIRGMRPEKRALMAAA